MGEETRGEWFNPVHTIIAEYEKIGLDRLGVKAGEVVMIFTPNQKFVPVAYLGIVGSRRVFSGSNPAYTVPGRSLLMTVIQMLIKGSRDGLSNPEY